MGWLVILSLVGLFSFGYSSQCPKEDSSPGKEIICYSSSFDIERLKESICRCTTFVHEGHDLKDFSSTSVEELNKSLKKINPLLQFVLSLNDVKNTLKTSATSRHQVIARLVANINKVDGYELNVTAGSKERLVHFIQGLKNEILRNGKDKRIFLSLPIKSEDLAKHINIKELSKYVDLFTIPTHYLMDNEENYKTFHPSRLMGLFDMLNADSLVDLVHGLGADKSKIIISLPANGYKFTLKDKNLTIPGAPADKSPVLISRSELCQDISNGEWIFESDVDLTAPYAFKDKTWIAFDDETSSGIKGKYVILRNLGGLAIRNIENDASTKCGKSITHQVYQSFTDNKRKTREAVLTSLRDDIYNTDNLFGGNLKSSDFRISRIVDTEGKIHAMRENTQTSFSCPHQGYFVHPKNCNRFYRCVKFNQEIEDYSIFEFDCPADLVFDEGTEVCVWPGSLSKGSACPGSSEIAPSNPRRFECSKEGYYADSQNCRFFFACMDLGGGKMTAYEFQCPYGLVFDESKLVCEWPWLVPSCAGKGYEHSDRGHGYSGNEEHDKNEEDHHGHGHNGNEEEHHHMNEDHGQGHNGNEEHDSEKGNDHGHDYSENEEHDKNKEDDHGHDYDEKEEHDKNKEDDHGHDHGEKEEHDKDKENDHGYDDSGKKEEHDKDKENDHGYDDSGKKEEHDKDKEDDHSIYEGEEPKDYDYNYNLHEDEHSSGPKYPAPNDYGSKTTTGSHETYLPPAKEPIPIDKPYPPGYQPTYEVKPNIPTVHNGDGKDIYTTSYDYGSKTTGIHETYLPTTKEHSTPIEKPYPPGYPTYDVKPNIPMVYNGDGKDIYTTSDDYGSKTTGIHETYLPTTNVHSTPIENPSPPVYQPTYDVKPNAPTIQNGAGKDYYTTSYDYGSKTTSDFHGTYQPTTKEYSTPIHKPSPPVYQPTYDVKPNIPTIHNGGGNYYTTSYDYGSKTTGDLHEIYLPTAKEHPTPIDMPSSPVYQPTYEVNPNIPTIHNYPTQEVKFNNPTIYNAGERDYYTTSSMYNGQSSLSSGNRFYTNPFISTNGERNEYTAAQTYYTSQPEVDNTGPGNPMSHIIPSTNNYYYSNQAGVSTDTPIKGNTNEDNAYKTNEYHDNGGRGTIKYNNGEVTTKYTEDDIKNNQSLLVIYPSTDVNYGVSSDVEKQFTTERFNPEEIGENAFGPATKKPESKESPNETPSGYSYNKPTTQFNTEDQNVYTNTYNKEDDSVLNVGVSFDQNTTPTPSKDSELAESPPNHPASDGFTDSEIIENEELVDVNKFSGYNYKKPVGDFGEKVTPSPQRPSTYYPQVYQKPNTVNPEAKVTYIKKPISVVDVPKSDFKGYSTPEYRGNIKYTTKTITNYYDHDEKYPNKNKLESSSTPSIQKYSSSYSNQRFTTDKIYTTERPIVTTYPNYRKLSTPKYELITKSNDIGNSKGKVIVKYSDLHPVLLGKLGAECTCSSSNPFSNFKSSKPLYINSSKGKIDLRNYDESDVYVDLDTSQELNSKQLSSTPSTLSKPIIVAQFNGPSKLTESQRSAPLYLPPANLYSRSGKSLSLNSNLNKNNSRLIMSEKINTLELNAEGGIECARPGLFRHPHFCNKFYTCHWDDWKKKFTLHTFNCPIHLTFDDKAGACNWPSKGPSCQENNLLI